MKYRLLIIVLFISTCVEAQKVWDQETYAAMCKKQLNEVLAHIYELVIEGKLTAYQNDSFATKMPIIELQKRFSDEQIGNVGVKEGEDWVVDTVIVTPKNPRESLVGFSLIQSNIFNNSDSTVFKTLGINLLYPLRIAGINLGFNPLCNIKWKELNEVLSIQEMEFLLAYIQTAKLFGNFEFIHLGKDTNDYLINDLAWRITNKSAPYSQRITSFWQQAIAGAWHRQYIEAAHLAYTSGKACFKEPQMRSKFSDVDAQLGSVITVAIANPDNPDDPYDLIDTTVQINYTWQTDKFILLKAPQQPKVIGFKTDEQWFYMKLEDIIPYLPKEVLPSLELLKKER